eukprot:s497_g16.t1
MSDRHASIKVPELARGSEPGLPECKTKSGFVFTADPLAQEWRRLLEQLSEESERNVSLHVITEVPAEEGLHPPALSVKDINPGRMLSNATTLQPEPLNDAFHSSLAGEVVAVNYLTDLTKSKPKSRSGTPNSDPGTTVNYLTDLTKSKPKSRSGTPNSDDQGPMPLTLTLRSNEEVHVDDFRMTEASAAEPLPKSVLLQWIKPRLNYIAGTLVVLNTILMKMKRIGQGGFAKAWLVESDEGKQAVCKAIDLCKTDEDDAGTFKEATLLASLRHPYIVRCLRVFNTEDGILCLIMDFCDGGELAKQIRRTRRKHQKIPEELVLRWFTQAMLALKYVHDKHIVHRDLKPGNFFLTKICQGSMPSFPDCYSDFLRKLCLQLLDRNPENRPSAGDVLRLPELRAVRAQLRQEQVQRQTGKSAGAAGAVEKTEKQRFP